MMKSLEISGSDKLSNPWWHETWTLNDDVSNVVYRNTRDTVEW